MKSFSALVAAVLLAGCTTTTYIDPSGARFSRTSFLNRQSAGRVEVRAGDKTLVIEGYTNEQTETAAAVAGAVTRELTRK